MKTCAKILFTGLIILSASFGCYGADNRDLSAAKIPDQLRDFSGKVVETMNAGGYTYVLVDTGTNKLWAAAPQFVVKVGDSVAIADVMAMTNYHSKTLNRDFEVVYFTGDARINGKRAIAVSQAGELPKNHPAIPGSSAVPTVDLSGIKKAKGGKTIEEVYVGKAKLSGKQVIVRGKVVKYNAMILGKNWVHLRDGTGAQGSNDLLVTTTSAVKIGDTVVATGVVSLNKDFGSNYKYDVMMEDAKLVVE